MSARLPEGGRLIDRSRKLEFRFDGARLTAHPGDTLASALLANGQLLQGRSFKYHRPRGPVASGPEEPNALFGIWQGARFEPNARATQVELHEGLVATSQNRWPALSFDIGALNDRLARFFPAGFYYKTFIWPRWAWKHLYEPFIRRAAGLGRPPRERDADRYEHFHFFCDVAVVGGGISGLQAALAAGRSGARVLLMEEDPWWGGRAVVDGPEIEGMSAEAWVEAALAELSAMENVTLRTRMQGAGMHDHGYLLAWERLSDHLPEPEASQRPRQRLWRVRAGQVIAANGAFERPLAFPGNDVPGVMLAAAVRDYLVNWAVAAGDRTVIVTNNDDAYRTALALLNAGLIVPAVIDLREEAVGPLAEAVRARGIRVLTGRGIAGVRGRKRVEGVKVCLAAGEGAVLEEIPCDAVAMSGGWTPAVHFWSHCGGRLLWDEERALFRPDPDRPPRGADGKAMVLPVGAANGVLTTGAALADADRGGKAAARATGHRASRKAPPRAEDEIEAPLGRIWRTPAGAGPALRMKMFLDFQNDVKVSDVELAAREGYESVEHTKRYTTLGMATDQGKTSNINGIEVLADALGEPIPQVGTTTFRPPWTPVTIGAIAGDARGETFLPVRRTPLHEWHEAHGAHWEPVGLWRRPQAYPREGEDLREAINREITNTRNGLGLLDASTLGKILVRGPDAPRFMDMLYTNMMSTLKPGRCRYGLMCNENGFLMDDGVVARLDEQTFLCHTTSGGAEHVHGWMERWLQTEWWDWKVWTLNVTEQWGQIAVVGPMARQVLEKLGGLDVSPEALPFMGWVEGTLGGISVRAYRISFSGELSFELAVPAGRTRELWDQLLEAGEEFGVMPYGTEALHVMRAEKGFIMIGDETDGTVTPRDLNLDWAISRKKEDFLGKRGMERPWLTRPDRWKLVGLETLDGSVLPDGAHALGEGLNELGQKRTIGRVTSSYFSPTLGRGIALGLVEGGMERKGQVLRFPVDDKGSVIEARVVDPVFYDPQGERQDV